MDPYNYYKHTEATNVSVNKKLYYLAVLLNVSNCCANPVVYALRIPEFRKALGSPKMAENATISPISTSESSLLLFSGKGTISREQYLRAEKGCGFDQASTFHSTKYSGLKFRVLLATNGTVFSGWLD